MTAPGSFACPPDRFRDLLAAGRDGDPAALRRLAAHHLSTGQLGRLSAAIAAWRDAFGSAAGALPFRLGIVGSHSTDFVAAALPAVALRHNVALECVATPFGQVSQAVLDPASPLKGRVDGVLIALDPVALGLSRPQLEDQKGQLWVDRALRQMRGIQAGVRDNLNAVCLFTSLPPPPRPMFGSYDLSFAGSPAAMIRAFNDALPGLRQPGDAIVDIAAVAGYVGLAAWHDPRLWFHAKLPFAIEWTPHYADAVCATIAAMTGHARRCLVLDLDNTLWGGTIGDDGAENIVLGPGSAAGEAHVALQAYALELRARGVILAVCSKNDHATAVAPFYNHPEMILKREHIATFVANWSDKASNLRTIARTLNIGTEAMVFVDDNPAERDLVRRELPEVAVPEIGGDPATYVDTVARGGWFDAVGFSHEDRGRAAFYEGNAARNAARGAVTDIGDYLASLDMVATMAPFDVAGRLRIAQLVNKSNQFNLTTRRYDEAQVAAIAADPAKFALQVRLIDRFGDNGMVSVVIFDGAGPVWSCDTWLMSCRVLGRRLEEAVLAEVVAAARRDGALVLRGTYLPTARNAVVADHFRDLGFVKVADLPDGGSEWELTLASYEPRALPIAISRRAAPGF